MTPVGNDCQQGGQECSSQCTTTQEQECNTEYEQVCRNINEQVSTWLKKKIRMNFYESSYYNEPKKF